MHVSNDADLVKENAPLTVSDTRGYIVYVGW